jgi:N-acetyl-gamma-glutamyl-phosphate reductase
MDLPDSPPASDPASASASDPDTPGSPIPVGVLGGSGYTGLEVTRLLARHPAVELRFTSSRSEKGAPSPAPGLPFTAPDPVAAAEVEVLFLCLPHGEAAAWVEALRSSGKKPPRIIDLTADHRPGSGREAGAVYGLNEWSRPQLAGAEFVANPGCYPTGVLLSLLPLVDAGLVDVERLTVVSAASGVTGAGRSARTDLLFAEVANNFRAYGWGNRHRHLLEMRALLPGVDLLFQPHLLPVPRGITETIVLPVRECVDASAVRSSWDARYSGEPAIRLVGDRLPALDEVVGTDLLALGAVELQDVREPAVLVGAALDNLGKGAAGQAVQNLNAIYGWPTEWGIRCA